MAVFSGNGSNTAPSFTFSSDTNTGMYRVGADELGLTTNGTAALTIDSSQSVTIPATAKVGGAGNFDTDTKLLVANTAGNSYLQLQGADSTGVVGVKFGRNSLAWRAGIDWSASSDAVNIRSGGSSAERITVLSNGYVGVNETSPAARLEVVDSLTNDATSATSAVNRICITDNSGSFGAGRGGGLDFEGIYGGLGRLAIYKENGANTGTARDFGEFSLLLASDVAEDGYAAFQEAVNIGPTAGLEYYWRGSNQLNIDSEGRVNVGTATAISGHYVRGYRASGLSYISAESASLINGETSGFMAVGTGAGATRRAEVGVFRNGNISYAAGFLRLMQDDGGESYYWSDNSANFRTSSDRNAIGTTSGTVVGTQTSDERLKNVLGPVDLGLEAVKQIEPVRFAFKDEPETEKLGFLAQQVRSIIPQSVYDTKEKVEGEPEGAETKLAMEYVQLIPVLVNAIKELSAEIDSLKAQL